MKVRTRSIPGVGGLDVDFTIPPALIIDKQLKEDEVLSGDIGCHVHLEMVNKDDVYLSGIANAKIEALCYRCGQEFEQGLRVPLRMTCLSNTHFHKDDKDAKNADIRQESEDGVVYFDNHEIDLSEIVREQVLLSLPMRYLCREDCQGVCLQCGAVLNLEPHHCSKVKPS